ncbi:MAG TPA: hypothetical protein VMX56_07540 [Anaerolineales bacterium]|nr:hypothetical protein [Anaerolineales bacterium]
MKRAVSISLGSSKRDKSVEVELLGVQVRIERIGTDGDMEKAAQLYRELDGKVDAFGVGGADLALHTDDRVYPLHSVKPMVRYVKKTPLVDGSGLKETAEARLADFVDKEVGLGDRPRRVLLTGATSRWGMAMSFLEADYDCIFGDLMFGLGIPIRIRTKGAVKILASVLLPVVSRVPFEWLYPTGEKQEIRTPKWVRDYEWATVIAGDCHYIMHSMPDQMDGKIIVTNTTTDSDVHLFKSLGVKTLVTSTTVYEGRSFGTNMMEAALVAVSGKGRTLTKTEILNMIDEIGFKPQVQTLN